MEVLKEIIETGCFFIVLFVLPVWYLVVGFNMLTGKKKSPPPSRGLTKEEEARDAITGEMWREMGGWD